MSTLYKSSLHHSLTRHTVRFTPPGPAPTRHPTAYDLVGGVRGLKSAPERTVHAVRRSVAVRRLFFNLT